MIVIYSSRRLRCSLECSMLPLVEKEATRWVVMGSTLMTKSANELCYSLTAVIRSTISPWVASIFISTLLSHWSHIFLKQIISFAVLRPQGRKTERIKDHYCHDHKLAEPPIVQQLSLHTHLATAPLRNNN